MTWFKLKRRHQQLVQTRKPRKTQTFVDHNVTWKVAGTWFQRPRIISLWLQKRLRWLETSESYSNPLLVCKYNMKQKLFGTECDSHTNTQLRYTTSMHWSLTQFTPASMSILTDGLHTGSGCFPKGSQREVRSDGGFQMLCSLVASTRRKEATQNDLIFLRAIIPSSNTIIVGGKSLVVFASYFGNHESFRTLAPLILYSGCIVGYFIWSTKKWDLLVVGVSGFTRQNLIIFDCWRAWEFTKEVGFVQEVGGDIVHEPNQDMMVLFRTMQRTMLRVIIWRGCSMTHPLKNTGKQYQ